MRDDKRFILDGFVFSTRKDYERACKEKETIEYLVANSNMSDMAVEKKSFQTVIGLEFIENMRKRLLSSGIVKENQLAYVPVVPRVKEKMSGKSITDKDVLEKNVEKYKNAYEAEKAGKKIKNMAIVFLCILLIAVIFITVKSKYSVFTYFTDYKSNMENELIDKYEKWEQDLSDKEKALDKREKEIQEKEERLKNK